MNQAVRWKPSVTVAAVIEQEGRFLLVEEHTDVGLRLNQPAGHLDPDESLVDAVAREAMEETAYSFVPTALLGCYMAQFQPPQGDPITYVRMAFTGELGPQDPRRSLDEGIVRTVWMTPDEIRASRERHRSPLLLACVEDYLAGKRYPLDVIHTHASVYGLGGQP
ncbi:NUDIX hydrolase [Ralstonia sp. 22086]|uniref:NUDIX hydrolase n=1 Tax=Ralstonia sp. 22086 TaxID=3453870 RepID=UPI003F84062F